MLRASLVVLFAGCQPHLHAHFTGRALPPIARSDELEVHPWREPPSGYRVLGMITAVCDTFNGASGLFELPCHDPTLLAAIKHKAARVGGSALLDLRCERRVLDTEVVRTDRGGAKVDEHARIRCQATVARHTSEPPSAPVARPSAQGEGERVRVGEVEVTIRFIAAADRAVEPRAPEQVGDLAHLPHNAIRLGEVSAACSACASSTARRGLKHAAARLGAVAITESNCEPDGDGWRCQAVAIGDAPRR